MAWQHVRLARFGGPEVLELAEQPTIPDLGPGEVRIKVLAAGTGFTDTFIRRGRRDPRGPAGRRGRRAAAVPADALGRDGPRDITRRLSPASMTASVWPWSATGPSACAA